MRAIIFDHYGPSEELTLQEVPAPQPQASEVTVSVRAAALNAADWHVMRADPFLVRLMCGFFKPRRQRLGADVAGVVTAAGSGVTRFKAGDEVFGCLPLDAWGSYAEQVCAAQDVLALKPARASFDEAAAVPLAGLTALQALREIGQLRAGQKVLINGGAGKQMAEAIFFGPWQSEKGGRRIGRVDGKPNQADMQFLAELLDAGKLKPVIDRRYGLAQVPEAIRYLEEGHARGKVVITVQGALDQ